MNTTANTTSTTRRCACGCEAAVAGKANYKPGHDARHAGSIGRDLAAFWLDGNMGSDHNMLDELPSAALKAKARRVAEKSVAKAEDKMLRAEAKTQAKEAAGIKKSMATKVAEEEAAHAEATKAPEPMFEDEAVLGEVKVGRWTYPAKYSNGQTLRNTKRDGSGEWVEFN